MHLRHEQTTHYLSARVKTSTQAATIFGCLLVKPFIISSYTKGTHYIHQSRPDLSPQTHLNDLMFFCFNIHEADRNRSLFGLSSGIQTLCHNSCHNIGTNPDTQVVTIKIYNNTHSLFCILSCTSSILYKH